MSLRLAVCVALLLAGCSGMPEVAARESAEAQAAPWPRLAPLPELLADADAPSRAKPAQGELGARAARLRARAAALRQTGG